MTDEHQETSTPVGVLSDAIRAVRARYDQLDRGQSAAIRRSRTANDLALEGAYWRVVGPLGREQRQLTQVVLFFPLAPHVTRSDFSFGSYLRKHLGDREGSILRFRRLLDSRDRDELEHRLRGVLKLASRDKSAVDWGILGLDILWFFAESDRVRRRWAQDFYAPSRTDAAAVAVSESASTNSDP